MNTEQDFNDFQMLHNEFVCLLAELTKQQNLWRKLPILNLRKKILLIDEMEICASTDVQYRSVTETWSINNESLIWKTSI